MSRFDNLRQAWLRGPREYGGDSFPGDDLTGRAWLP
jgi:hypothetical protein